MSRPELEVAEIFRRHGAAWREANRGHVSLEQLKVMSAIERCRTAALGGHVARCENGACGHTIIAYCSCLMGKAGNGELAVAMTVFSCVFPRSHSPLHVARAAPWGRPLMAGHEWGRTCWRRTSRRRRCWGICGAGQADHIDVRGYFMDRASSSGSGTVEKLTTSLRAFLRYLAVEGRCQADLDNAVPLTPIGGLLTCRGICQRNR